jgi:hypothetical protein
MEMPGNGSDLEARLTALEDQVGEIAAKLEMDPDSLESVKNEGLTEEAQDVLDANNEGDTIEESTSQEKLAEEIKEKEDPSVKEEKEKDATSGESLEEAEELEGAKKDKTDTETTDEKEVAEKSEDNIYKEKDAGKTDLNKTSSRRRIDPARQLSSLISRIKNSF